MHELTHPEFVPYTIIIPTVYGAMLIDRYDSVQGKTLINTGYSAEHNEILLLCDILRCLGTGLVAIDIGASFGTYSLGLCRAVGHRGKIYAFEPQRMIFNMLSGTVALNAIENIYCYNMAVGAARGMIELPQFNYGEPLNFGGVEFSSKQKEPLSQLRGQDPSRNEFVHLTTIDRFEFERADLIKIDAEGMELEILDGALDTIKRCRPILYVEFLKVDRATLLDKLIGMSYRVRQNKIDFLCIPSEFTEKLPRNAFGRLDDECSEWL